VPAGSQDIPGTLMLAGAITSFARPTKQIETEDKE
jgi:hypothetical protein